MSPSRFYEDAHIMNIVENATDYGTAEATITQGAAIMCGFVEKSASEVTPAEHNAVKSVWAILHDTDFTLKQNDVVRRDSTGVYYRITGEERQTPAPAGLQYRIASAEVIAL